MIRSVGFAVHVRLFANDEYRQITHVCYHYTPPLGLINHRTQLCLARSTQSTQASGLDQSEVVSKDITTKEVST